MASRGKIGIGLIGLGTVGTSVVELLAAEQDVLRARIGEDLAITCVCDRGVAQRGEKLPGLLQAAKPGIVADPLEVVAEKSVDVVVELIGGTSPAKEVALAAIEAGKPFVTANKALLALHGNEIFAAAAAKNVPLGYEASVAGGIPILNALRGGLAGDRVTAVRGIINGTANYILSEMFEKGDPFEEVLKRAQEAGYAEADPTFDVEGIDAAHKLALLASLAFGTQINFDDITCEGISGITPEDIEFGRRFGYRIKLLAIAKVVDEELELRVHPVMLPDDRLLAQIQGATNAIEVESAAIGQTVFVGPGAGGHPTAGAVLGDLVACCRAINRSRQGDSEMRAPVETGLLMTPPRLVPEGELRELPVRAMGAIKSAYYLRVTARDEPGVLARIAGILGEAGVSIAELFQPLRSKKESVPIVLLTHRTREEAVRKALPEIDTLDVVETSTVLIRVEDRRL